MSRPTKTPPPMLMPSAIYEEVSRQNIRFVPIKNTAQPSVLALHWVRQGFVKARTAQANQIRGLPGEFKLRYVPHGAPRSLRSQRSRMVWRGGDFFRLRDVRAYISALLALPRLHIKKQPALSS